MIAMSFLMDNPNYTKIFSTILMHIFEKLPQISGRRPILKFDSDPLKSNPQNFWWTLNRDILHKLLGENHEPTFNVTAVII